MKMMLARQSDSKIRVAAMLNLTAEPFADSGSAYRGPTGLLDTAAHKI